MDGKAGTDAQFEEGALKRQVEPRFPCNTCTEWWQGEVSTSYRGGVSMCKDHRHLLPSRTLSGAGSGDARRHVGVWTDVRVTTTALVGAMTPYAKGDKIKQPEQLERRKRKGRRKERGSPRSLVPRSHQPHSRSRSVGLNGDPNSPRTHPT